MTLPHALNAVRGLRAGRLRPALVAAAATVAATLAVWPLAPAGAAEENQEWAITPIQPAPGASIPEPSSPSVGQVFEFRASPPSDKSVVDVTVWSRNPTEAGNTLPAEGTVDRLVATASPASPSVYKGRAFGTWLTRPGTYYWRATASHTEGAPSHTVVNLASPVFTVSVLPASSQPATGAEQKALEEQRGLEEPAARCGRLRGRAASLGRRMRPLERALHRTRAHRTRKRLRAKLRRLRHERSNARREERHLCH